MVPYRDYLWGMCTGIALQFLVSNFIVTSYTWDFMSSMLALCDNTVPFYSLIMKFRKVQMKHFSRFHFYRSYCFATEVWKLFLYSWLSSESVYVWTVRKFAFLSDWRLQIHLFTYNGPFSYISMRLSIYALTCTFFDLVHDKLHMKFLSCVCCETSGITVILAV